jgi:fatty acid-binding protein DegV
MHLLYGNNGQEDIMNPASPQQVAIVTDSTADLPLDLINKYGIHVIPLYLIMSGNTWRDGVDISPAKFYELLKTSPDFPKTSQPNEADFEGLFSKLSRFQPVEIYETDCSPVLGAHVGPGTVGVAFYVE